MRLGNAHSLITSTDFFKKYFHYHVSQQNLYYALKQIKAIAYEKYHEMYLGRTVRQRYVHIYDTACHGLHK